MNYLTKALGMGTVAKGPNHGVAPILQEGRWTKVSKNYDKYKLFTN